MTTSGINVYLRSAQAYMLISIPTETSAIFGVFQAIEPSTAASRGIRHGEESLCFNFAQENLWVLLIAQITRRSGRGTGRGIGKSNSCFAGRFDVSPECSSPDLARASP